MDDQVKFPDGFDEPDPIAFGLAAPQLLVCAAMVAFAYLVSRLSLTGYVIWPAVVVILGLGAVMGWVRVAGRPALAWAGTGLGYATRPRSFEVLAMSRSGDGDQPAQPWEQWLAPPSEAEEATQIAPPALVMAPPLASAESVDESDDEEPQRGVIVPLTRGFDEGFHDSEDELGDFPVEPADPPAHGPTSVFVGATRRVMFFGLNGGTGRTTLATEVAGLLAARGRHSRDGVSSEPLKVALLDLDLRSATVAVRLGLTHPTVWDLVMGGDNAVDDLDKYLVTHRSGLRALLGPPKPLPQAGPVTTAQLAAVLHRLESDGVHFIFIDAGNDLGPVTTWALGVAHDIFVVITPTASGVQDAYRTTEALRRMGMRNKLSYVVNRAGGQVDVREVMSDLNGRLVATIPQDSAFEEAENSHRLAALASGPAADAIAHLAAHLYPPLQAVAPKRRLSAMWKRRVG